MLENDAISFMTWFDPSVPPLKEVQEFLEQYAPTLIISLPVPPISPIEIFVSPSNAHQFPKLVNSALLPAVHISISPPLP